MAMTGNGANDTPVQSQVERDKTVATNEDSRYYESQWKKVIRTFARFDG